MNITDKKTNREKWKARIVEWRSSGLSQDEGEETKRGGRCAKFV